MSADALKRNMKEGGLDEDAVHDTMDDLKDVSYDWLRKTATVFCQNYV